MMMEPRKILVVEDDKIDAQLIHKRLTRNHPGAQITWVNSLKRTEAAMKAERFDLIILDLNLPDGFGVTSVKEIKSIEPNVPVIVITGMASPITVAEAKKAGAAKVITKSKIIKRNF